MGCNLRGQCAITGATDVGTPSTIGALLGLQIVQVAAGLNHTAVLSSSGDVYTFGANECGQLGHGGCGHELAPRLVECAALADVNVAEIACGSRCGTDSVVWIW